MRNLLAIITPYGAGHRPQSDYRNRRVMLATEHVIAEVAAWYWGNYSAPTPAQAAADVRPATNTHRVRLELDPRDPAARPLKWH